MATPRTKTVYFYRVGSRGNLALQEVFLNRDFHLPFNLDGKTLELKFPEQNRDGIITGSFVMTRTTGIPPKHMINTDDYDAVELEDGEGLSYPNVFLFNPAINVLALEFNMNGAYPSQIEQILRQFALNRNHLLDQSVEPFNLVVNIHELLSIDAYMKMMNMESFQKVTMKIAHPTELVNNEINSNGPMEMVGELAEEMSATAFMEISFSAEMSGNIQGLDKNAVLNLARKFNEVSQILLPRRGRNKLVVEGMSVRGDNPEILDREIIDITKDRMRATFQLTEPNVLTTIQYVERKREILDTYLKKLDEINMIVS